MNAARNFLPHERQEQHNGDEAHGEPRAEVRSNAPDHRPLEGQLRLLSYSGRQGDFINSIGRGHLNELLLDKLSSYPNATIHFNQKCTNVDLNNNLVLFKNEEDSQISQLNFNKIIGTDGADSTLRKAIYQSLGTNNMDIHTEFLDHGYKELNIPATEKGDFAMDPNALHIWPRGDFMMIALPNLDRSFTVTLFLSNDQGEENFAKLESRQSVIDFFNKYFHDAIGLMPTFNRQFFNNPIGLLGTTKRVFGHAVHARQLVYLVRCADPILRRILFGVTVQVQAHATHEDHFVHFGCGRYGEGGLYPGDGGVYTAHEEGRLYAANAEDVVEPGTANAKPISSEHDTEDPCTDAEVDGLEISEV